MKVYKAPNRKTKVSAIAVCLLLTAMLAIGGVLAYLFTQSSPVTNTFNPVTPGTEVGEKLEHNVKKEVAIKNTGKVDSYIRAKVIITWQDEEGNVYPIVPAKGTDYTIVYATDAGSGYNTTTKWVYGADDSFWYHTEPVKAGESTGILVVYVTPKDTEPDGYTLHVEILSQAIQSDGTDTNGVTPVQDKWGVTISTGKVEPFTKS